MPGDQPERFLTPAEVSRLLRVDRKTMIRYEGRGTLHPIRTPGGHRRYRESEILSLISATPQEEPQ